MLSFDARARVDRAAARPAVRLSDSTMEYAATAILELVAARARSHYRGRLVSSMPEASEASVVDETVPVPTRGVRQTAVPVPRRVDGKEPVGSTTMV